MCNRAVMSDEPQSDQPHLCVVVHLPPPTIHPPIVATPLILYMFGDYILIIPTTILCEFELVYIFDLNVMYDYTYI